MTVKKILEELHISGRISIRILHSSGYDILAGGSPDFVCDKYGSCRIQKSEVHNNMLIIYVEKDETLM